MKGKNTKAKSIFVFLGMLILVAAISGLAVLACMGVGKEQVAKVEVTQETKAETEQAKEVKDEEAKEETTEETKLPQIAQKKIRLGLDLQGGVNIVYEPKLDRAPTAEEMSAARLMIQKRLDAKGYTEAEVSQEGNKRIRVDIPGVDDPQKAIEEIGAAGLLRFVDMQGNEIVTGKNVQKATPQAYNGNAGTEIVVSVEMDSEGTKLFSDFTKDHIGEQIFILLDETFLSAPTIQAHIQDGKGQISGSFTIESAQELADGINAGALPFALEPVNSMGIGAKLGLDSLNSSLIAGLIGFILILIFMGVMYRGCGLAADIALTLYIALLILVLTAMEATLTLPGIAGILLSIGMAVDANIIIFVRIKEELNLGRSVRSAVDAGFQKAFSAILDGNVTTLIAAVVLYIFGTGLIKSFATTLGIGIVISMFTALVVTRILLKAFVNMDIRKPAFYAIVKKQSKEA
ncbi:protein translocase subunit SecD [Sporanaerobium hydrogeniformans]|uniref:Protein translocase subunit SecD n=1 Tax=Sporanaerobium hydrogeniformans TaxID=3072179 RepID=A0AC61DH32_9FIRM|nr:protein translocase subunit SecD [Sporanaerobium hydrogeniformans]PHV71642.1 protein translocase subunit SecD [Sporanaerobium hydrogeniformans]